MGNPETLETSSEATDITRSEKSLLHHHDDPSVISRTDIKKKTGMVVT